MAWLFFYYSINFNSAAFSAVLYNMKTLRQKQIYLINRPVGKRHCGFLILRSHTNFHYFTSLTTLLQLCGLQKTSPGQSDRLFRVNVYYRSYARTCIDK